MVKVSLPSPPSIFPDKLDAFNIRVSSPDDKSALKLLSYSVTLSANSEAFTDITEKRVIPISLSLDSLTLSDVGF